MHRNGFAFHHISPFPCCEYCGGKCVCFPVTICGDTLPSVNDTYTIFIKEIEKGGGYNLENIAILCNDCHKILNSKNEKQTLQSLTINDKLLVFCKN